MKDSTKVELDAKLLNKNMVIQERRRDPQMEDFEAHLDFLAEFGAVQDQVIKPMMVSFGRYLAALGHRFFIATAQEIDEGHRYPVSRITLHLFLNSNMHSIHTEVPSYSFRADENRRVCVYKRNGVAPFGCSAVGHYDMQAITSDLVETHLKEFVIEILSVARENCTPIAPCGSRAPQ